MCQWQRSLFILLIDFSSLLVNLAEESFGNTCVWLNPGNEWSTGKKLYAVIPMDQAYNGWKIELNFTTSLTSLEAWKGDVTELAPTDGTMWQITNKCYNGLLYSCQCLERTTRATLLSTPQPLARGRLT